MCVASWAGQRPLCSAGACVGWRVMAWPQALPAGGKGPWDSRRQREPMPMCWAGPLTGDLVPLAPRHLTGRGNALRWGGTETWTSPGPLARRKARAPCNTLRARKGQHSRRLQTACRPQSGHVAMGAGGACLQAPAWWLLDSTGLGAPCQCGGGGTEQQGEQRPLPASGTGGLTLANPGAFIRVCSRRRPEGEGVGVTATAPR